VIVDGKWKKRDFKLVVNKYPDIVKRFLRSAARIQAALIKDTASKALPAPGTPSFQGGTAVWGCGDVGYAEGVGGWVLGVVFGGSEGVRR